MAVTREGISIREWSWLGDTGEAPLLRQVRGDLAGWQVGPVVWVAVREVSSWANRVDLSQDGEHYVLGEKLGGVRGGEARALPFRPLPAGRAEPLGEGRGGCRRVTWGSATTPRNWPGSRGSESVCSPSGGGDRRQ